MNRFKLGSMVILTALGISMSGCGKEAPEAVSVGSQTTITQEQENVEDAQAPVIKERTEATNSTESTGSQERTESGQCVSNNGGHFIAMDDMIYYLSPDEDAMYKSELFGEYLDFYCGTSFLMGYNCKTDGIETIKDGQFYGKLWGLKDKVFVNCDNTHDDVYFNRVAIINPADRKVEFADDEQVVGGDNGGNYVITNSVYRNNVMSIYMYNDASDKTEYKLDSYFAFIGTEDGYIVGGYMDEDSNWRVMCIDTNDSGKIYDLGKVPDRELESYENYPEFEQCFIEDGIMYLSICWYEGTGHFFAEQAVVKANLTEEGSLQKIEVQKAAGLEEHEWADAFVVSGDSIKFCEGIPQTGFCDYSGKGEYGYYDDNGQRVVCGDGFGIVYDDNGDMTFENECVEYVDGKLCMVNNWLVRDPDEDIGWRYAYKRTYTSIYVEEPGSNLMRNIENICNQDYLDED